MNMKILFIGARLFDEVALYAQSKGIETILSESNPKSPNLNLADEYHIVSRGMNHPMDIAISEDVDAVVPLIGIDKPLLEVAKMKEKLEKEHHLPVIASGINATAISTDKITTKDFLTKNNINTPHFVEISKNQYNASKSSLNFPKVLKQPEGQGGAGVKIALSSEDADAYFKLFPQAIMEDFINGAEISVEVLRWNNKSVPLVGVYKGDTTLEGTHPLKKIRTAPINHENLNNHELRKLAKKITDELGASGTTEVEFIFDNKNQHITALEINTRPSGTRYLSFSSTNINPMHQLVNMALGEWKPHKIEREIKQYAALEMPLPVKKTPILDHLPENKHHLERQNFSHKKPWIIHGPENASRITVRAKNRHQPYEILKKLKIMDSIGE